MVLWGDSRAYTGLGSQWVGGGHYPEGSELTLLPAWLGEFEGVL